MTQVWDRTQTKNIVIHHFGDGVPAAISRNELIRRANPPQPGFPNGWEFPEYDFGILADGTVIELRPLTYKGAHTVADRPKYKYGPNWWNYNSVSVVLGIDSTLFQPSTFMVESLINFLISFCQSRGGGIDNMYPHFQVTQTDCPGASYAKLGFNTGFLDYDYVEGSVKTGLDGGVRVMPIETGAVKPAIVVFGIWDLVGAYRLAGKLKASILLRETNWKASGFNKFYILGGPEEAGADVVNITGDDWEGTMKELLEALK